MDANRKLLGRRRRGLALAALALAIGGSARLPAQSPPALRVTYLSATAVYLDGGRAEGLAVGARLRVTRGGEPVAELEIDFVAEHSASCRVVSQLRPVLAGDRAEAIAGGAGPPQTADAAPGPGGSSGEPSPLAATTSPAPPRASSKVESGRNGAATRWYGSLGLGVGRTSDDLGASSNETTGRFSLWLSEISGRPLELRVRSRARRISRDGYGPSVERDQSSDRLYELSLAWEPPAGRFALEIGRLGAGPFGALGDVDGALVRMRLGRGFSVGAFGGSTPGIGELGIESEGTKYGGFLRYVRDAEAGGPYTELVFGGVAEQSRSGEISREYLTIESRFGAGSRWWFFQRAEVDLHRGWRRDTAGESAQVSNAAIATSFRLSDAWTASLAYDQRRNYLTWETQPRPEEIFVRYFREGTRVRVDWRGAAGWSASLGGGVERAREIDDPTTSGALSILWNEAFGAPLALGGDLSAYSGGLAEGWVASLRGRWSFRGGHDVGLTLGGSEASFPDRPEDDARLDSWARLSATLQLPARLSLYGEYELETGDEIDGDRAHLEVVYRF